MIRVIAITQFVFLALGAFTLNVIVKANVFPVGTDGAPPSFSLFLARNSPWFLTLPILWVVFASICESVGKGLFSVRIAHVAGVFLATVIFFAYWYAIFIQN